MSQSRVKTGRFAVGAIGALILGLGLAIGISWTLMIAVATGLIWITRSVFAYSSILGAVADALLCIAALGLATGAYTMTGSFVWAIWCFFLVQAMFAVIPAAGPPVNPGAASGAAGPGDTFTRAQAAAEMALRQIALRE